MLIYSYNELLFAVVVDNDNTESHEENLKNIPDLFLEYYYPEVSSSQPALSEKSASELTQVLMWHNHVDD